MARFPNRIIAALSLLALVLAAHADKPAQYSPQRWPKAELEKYSALQLVYDFPRPLAEAKHAMIGGTTGPLAIHAGYEVLKSGGSAMDAALATAMAEIVLAGGSWVSFGGLMYVVYFDAKTGKVYALNAGYNTFRDEASPLTIPSGASGRTALVPGFLGGVEAAHKRFGVVPFARLFDPAIYLAENGFAVDTILDAIVRYRKDVLSRLPETKAIFTKPDGTFYRKGDLFKQPELAKTLRYVASQGTRYIYTGQWADEFVKLVRREGGNAAIGDLQSYHADWEEPVRVGHGPYEVCAVGPPEYGGVNLLEALNVVEASGLTKAGRPSASPQVLRDLIQISRLGFVNTYGTPPPGNRLSKAAAAAQWERVRKPGWDSDFIKLVNGSHSDAVVSVDARGNVCALVHSSNCISWGSTGIFVDGISIPDSASFQQFMVSKAGPGKRLPNTTNPVMVLKGGKPFLAASAIGAGLHETMLQNLVNVLDYGMDPKASVDSPTFWGPVWGAAGGKGTDYGSQAVSAEAFSTDLLDAVRKLGQPIKELTPAEESMQIGYWLGIRLTDGKLQGAVFPKLNGIVEGY